MKKDSCASTLAFNFFELKQLPIFKIETHRWIKFQDKQKFLPFFRSVTYQCKQIMSKMFLFDLTQQKKERLIKRKCVIITQKQLLSLQDLYQVLSKSMSQAEFNEEVQRIKQFQKVCSLYITNKIADNYVKFRTQPHLTFHIYRDGAQYCIKATIAHFHFELEYFSNPKNIDKPQKYVIKNALVKEFLDKKLADLLQMVHTIKPNAETNRLYQSFYDKIYFHYDEYHLRLQVYQNYPLLRLKNYLPVQFTDKKTQQPLQGPIFANSDAECMYSHLSGYNANTTKQLEGSYCESCQIKIEEFQQFELLMMLRDNVLNPQRRNIIYNPEHNRFKFLTKIVVIPNNQESQGEEQVRYEKTIIDYLNYYHLKINLKKLTNKIRMSFMPRVNLETFPLTFKLQNREFIIMDPAKGRYCQHFAFTDLRLYYKSFNPQTNLYTCPIPGCKEKFQENDLLYIRQVEILMEYAKFKLEGCLELINTAKVFVDNQNKKVSIGYTIKEEQKGLEQRKEELTDYYKTLVDPFIAFSQYGLGIRQKQRKQKMNQYMFGGWKKQMQEQINYIEQEYQQEEI